jgi:DNA-binding MarR family transcriptional regulator
MAPPRWLSDDEQRAWRGLLAVTRTLFDTLDRQLQSDSGMPHTYYMILATLSEAPERTLRMTELACATLSSASRISHAVARLEQTGWVRRRQCGVDGRGISAQLTDAGHAVLVAAAPRHVAAVRQALFDRLSPEQIRHLTDICETVLAGG